MNRCKGREMYSFTMIFVTLTENKTNKIQSIIYHHLSVYPLRPLALLFFEIGDLLTNRQMVQKFNTIGVVPLFHQYQIITTQIKNG